MKQQPIEIAISVFAFSVATGVLCIRALRRSLSEWLEHPHRRLLFFDHDSPKLTPDLGLRGAAGSSMDV